MEVMNRVHLNESRISASLSLSSSGCWGLGEVQNHAQHFTQTLLQIVKCYLPIVTSRAVQGNCCLGDFFASTRNAKREDSKPEHTLSHLLSVWFGGTSWFYSDNNYSGQGWEEVCLLLFQFFCMFICSFGNISLLEQDTDMLVSSTVNSVVEITPRGKLKGVFKCRLTWGTMLWVICLIPVLTLGQSHEVHSKLFWSTATGTGWGCIPSLLWPPKLGQHTSLNTAMNLISESALQKHHSCLNFPDSSS